MNLVQSSEPVTAVLVLRQQGSSLSGGRSLILVKLRLRADLFFDVLQQILNSIAVLQRRRSRTDPATQRQPIQTALTIFLSVSKAPSKMSGSAASSAPTTKLQESKEPETDPAKTSQQLPQPGMLEEDDEFEDFPVEGNRD